MRRSILTLAVLLGLVNLAQPSAAQGQAWPTRPVKLILPLGPGSGTDTIARLFADRLATRWGKPVVVENKPGGDGIIAITTFLQANDDHTLLFTATSAFTGHPYLHDKLPYDPQALIPAARVCDTLVVLAVPESLNVKTVKELVDMARAQPGKLNAASITGLLDLVFNGFLKSAKLDIAKVPYRDPVQALNDLAEGRIQMLMTSITIVRAQVQAGRVRMLALTNAKSSRSRRTFPRWSKPASPISTWTVWSDSSRPRTPRHRCASRSRMMCVPSSMPSRRSRNVSPPPAKSSIRVRPRNLPPRSTNRRRAPQPSASCWTSSRRSFEALRRVVDPACLCYRHLTERQASD